MVDVGDITSTLGDVQYIAWIPVNPRAIVT